MWRHSSALTGVIESRLPRLRTTIVASAGSARMSASEKRRVFRTSLTSTFSHFGASGRDFGSW